MASYDEFDAALGEDFLQDSSRPEEEVVFEDDEDATAPPSVARTVTSPLSPPARNTRSQRPNISPLQIHFSPAIRSAKKKKGHGETRLRHEMEAMRTRQGSGGVGGVGGYYAHRKRRMHWFWRLLMVLLLSMVTSAIFSVYKDPALLSKWRDFLNAVPHAQTYKLKLDDMQEELWRVLNDSSSLRLDLQAAQDKAREDRQQAQIVRAKLKTMEEKFEKVSKDHVESEQDILRLKQELQQLQSEKETEDLQLRQQREQMSDLLHQFNSERSERKALELEKEHALAQLRESRQQAEMLRAQLYRFEQHDVEQGNDSLDAAEIDREIAETRQIEEARLTNELERLRQEKENQLTLEMQEARERKERNLLQQMERIKKDQESKLAAEIKQMKVEQEKHMSNDLEVMRKKREDELANEFSQKILTLQELERSATNVATVKRAVESIHVHMEKAQDKVLSSGPSIIIPTPEPSILIKSIFKEGEPILAVPKVFGRMKDNVEDFVQSEMVSNVVKKLMTSSEHIAGAPIQSTQSTMLKGVFKEGEPVFATPRVIKEIKQSVTNSTKEVWNRGQNGSRAAGSAVLSFTKESLNQTRNGSRVVASHMATSIHKLSSTGRKHISEVRESIQTNTRTLGGVSMVQSKKLGAKLEKQIESVASAGMSRLDHGWQSVSMLGLVLVSQSEKLMEAAIHAAREISDRCLEAISSALTHSVKTINDAATGTKKYITKQGALVTRVSQDSLRASWQMSKSVSIEFGAIGRQYVANATKVARNVRNKAGQIVMAGGAMAHEGFQVLSQGVDTALKYTELKAVIAREVMAATWNGLQTKTVADCEKLAEIARHIFASAESVVQQREMKMIDGGPIDAKDADDNTVSTVSTVESIGPFVDEQKENGEA